MKRILLVILTSLALLGSSVAAVDTKDAKAATPPVYSPRNGAIGFNIPRARPGHEGPAVCDYQAAERRHPVGAAALHHPHGDVPAQHPAHCRRAHRRPPTRSQRPNLDRRRGAPHRHHSLRRELGRSKKSRSFVATCSHSCMSNAKSTMHAKFLLLSQSGNSKWVSMISSGNPFRGNVMASWNNNHTIVDAKIYRALHRYFYDMLPDRNRRNYRPAAMSSGRTSLFFFPQASQRRTEWLSALNGVRCTGVARGYGVQGRTRIRVAQWGWTTSRVDLANKLRSLHAQGCKVEVILNKGLVNKAVFRALLRPTKRGKVRVYDAWRDGNRNGVPSHYHHHKVMTIDGKWRGRSQRVVYTGSQNWSLQGTTVNNDIILRYIGDNRIHGAYMTNLNMIRNRVGRRITTVPANPKIPRQRGRVAPDGSQPLVPAPDERYVPGTDPKVPTSDGFLKEGVELEEFAEE